MRLIPKWAVAIADQGVVAVTNLGLTIMFARVGGLHTLGTYAILSSTLLIALGLSRMLVMEPWLVSQQHFSASPGLRALIATTSGLSAIAAAAFAVLVGGGGPWLLTVVVALAWLPQDAGRFIAFKSGEPRSALTSDGLILVCLLVGIAVLTFSGADSGTALEILLGSWAVGQLVGLAAIWKFLAGRVRARGALGWWDKNLRTTATALAHDGVAYLLANNGTLYLLAAVASTADAGLIRMTTSVFSPLSLAFTGLTMWLVPLLARLGDDAARAAQTRVSLILAAVSLPLLVVAVWIGPQLTILVFHVAEAPSRTAILMAGIATCLVAIGSPWMAAAKVRGRYRPVAWARTVAAVLALGALATVALAQSATGYLALLMLQNILVTGTAVVVVRRMSRVPV